MSSTRYAVVYGPRESDLFMYDSYQDAVQKLRKQSLNTPTFTCRLDIYRLNEDGEYCKETSDDEW